MSYSIYKDGVVVASSSNKHQTLPENKIHGSHTAGPKQASTAALKPFIDKISVTMTVPTVQFGKDMYEPHSLAQKDIESFPRKKAPAGYRYAMKLPIAGIAEERKWPLYAFQWVDLNGPEQPKARYITNVRIEFVPVDLGPAGILELHAVLSSLMDGGWGCFIKHGKITRIDVAIDLPHVQMDQFLLLPTQVLTTTRWSNNGELESIQYGKPKNSHTLIYNRAAKRESMGQSPEGKEGVRVERRQKGLNLKFDDLPALPFPFKGTVCDQLYPAKPDDEKKAYIWQHFLCAVQVKGLNAALASLPPTKRTIYRKHLNHSQANWWDPDAIWGMWGPMLSDLGIADLKSFE